MAAHSPRVFSNSELEHQSIVPRLVRSAVDGPNATVAQREAMTQHCTELRLQLSQKQLARQKPPSLAVIDIGSNSVRLVIYDKLCRAPIPVINEKSFCRLALGLSEPRRLSTKAMGKVVHVLRNFRRITDSMNVEQVDVIATEAIRRADNGVDLVRAIKAHTGLEVRILSGDAEAYFSALGVISGFDNPRGLVGDLGGGSLEIAEVDGDHVGKNRVSLPLGTHPINALISEHRKATKNRVDEILESRLAHFSAKSIFYAVGGSWRALAEISIAANACPVAVVHGYELDAQHARVFARSISRMSADQIHALPGAQSKRANALAAAALVLARLIRFFQPNRIVFSARGLREGWLYSHLPTQMHEIDPMTKTTRDITAPLASRPRLIADAVVR